MANREACCPKCRADIGDTFEPADWSVGINAGYYCDACDIGVAEHEAGDYEPSDGDVQISFASDASVTVGTPFSELASQPGDTPEQNAKYENCKRIARSWGYD